MKINKIFIAIFTLVAITMAACSEWEDTVEQSPVVPSDNPAVRFAAANPGAVEVDAEVLSFSIQVVRDNSSQAIEVPVTVVDDTTGVFNVPGTVAFADGQDTVDITITINENVPYGTPLGLVLELDESYTNPYKSAYPVLKTTVTVPPPCELNKLRIIFNFDGYASETTWQLTTESGEVVGEGGPYTDGLATETVDFCIEDGTYTFTVNDQYGDGLTYPEVGGVLLLSGTTEIVNINGDFGSSTSETFTLGAE